MPTPLTTIDPGVCGYCRGNRVLRFKDDQFNNTRTVFLPGKVRTIKVEASWDF